MEYIGFYYALFFIPALTAGGNGKCYKSLEYAIAFWLSSRTLRPSSKDS